MAFRKTPEEIAEIRAAFTDPVYVRTKTLTASFETTPEAIAAVLPPPLEPTGRPYAACGIGEFNSSVGVWKGGGVYIPARYGDMTGQYVLAMYGDLDSPCFYGRAQFGEPKKLAEITFEREGSRMRGSIRRQGITIAEIDGELTERGSVPEGLQPPSGTSFNFKFALNADASGFEWGPVLMRNSGGISETFDVRSGQGTLTFGVSPHDPLADLPVLRVRGISYAERSSYGGATVAIAGAVNPEAYYPYALAQFDALDAFHRDAKALAGEEALARAGKFVVPA